MGRTTRKTSRVLPLGGVQHGILEIKVSHFKLKRKTSPWFVAFRQRAAVGYTPICLNELPNQALIDFDHSFALIKTA